MAGHGRCTGSEKIADVRSEGGSVGALAGGVVEALVEVAMDMDVDVLGDASGAVTEEP